MGNATFEDEIMDIIKGIFRLLKDFKGIQVYKSVDFSRHPFQFYLTIKIPFDEIQIEDYVQNWDNMKKRGIEEDGIEKIL